MNKRSTDNLSGMRMAFLLLTMLVFPAYLHSQSKEYICPPCGCESDGKVFEHAGDCPSCGMTLLNKHNKSEGLSYTNLDAQEICDLKAKNPDILFLDVRTEREFNSSPLGRIKDAKHIHVNELSSRVSELAEFKDKEIVVYCLVGIRSARASTYLSENGFTKVSNMLGGMENWNNLSSEELKCKTALLEKN